MNQVCYTAICYASISPGLLVQGWELSAPLPEAVVPAGMSDTWQYLLLLIQIIYLSPAGVSVILNVFKFNDRVERWAFQRLQCYVYSEEHLH